jgi:hypothetical protein
MTVTSRPFALTATSSGDRFNVAWIVPVAGSTISSATLPCKTKRDPSALKVALKPTMQPFSKGIRAGVGSKLGSNDDRTILAPLWRLHSSN